MEIRKVGIVDFARSPISKAKGGALNKLSSLQIGGQVIQKLLARNEKVPQNDIEMVVAGCAFPEGENGFNIGRALVVKSGLPNSVAGFTVNHFCASSQQSLMIVADAIATGKGDIGIAVGLEHMVRVPMGGYNPAFDKELKDKDFYINMGDTAENLANDLEISRADQEQFAIDSHKKALAAQEQGIFSEEILPIDLPDGSTVNKDECPREPNEEKIRSLKPAFQAEGTVTAATSSPVTTGAAAIVVMSEEKAKELGIPLRAIIKSSAYAGCDYTRMGMGPLPATDKALKRAQITMDDIDIIELNEAFAAQSLYVIRKGNWPMDKINVYGGAIAIGHPLGMSGARIVGAAVNALEKKNGKYALATLCIGGGQGAAIVLERS